MEKQSTLQEYKNYVKRLKLKIRSLKSKNSLLLEKVMNLEKNSKTLSKNDIIKYSLKINRKVSLLQKHVRGFLARRKFQKIIKKALKEKNMNPKKKITSNFKILQQIANSLNPIGLNLEMLFRASNSKNSKFLKIEEFKIFLQRLKLKLKKSQIARFTYLLDQDFKGQISEEEYLETLICFGVNSEERTFEIGQKLKEKLMKKFIKNILKMEGDIKIIFDNDFISFPEFLDFFENSLDEDFKEKEKYFILRFFDARELGYIEKSSFFKEVRNLKKKFGNLRNFEEIENDADEVVLHQERSQRIEMDENYLTQLFLNKFEKYNKNLKSFTDILGLYVFNNLSIFKSKQNSISLRDFKKFLTDNFLIILGKDLIDNFVNNIYDRNTKFLSNYEKENLKKKNNKFEFVEIDLIELKNKLVNFSNSNADTTKLILIIASIKLNELDIPTSDYLKKYGYNIKRKVDFSEFFILAQKILSANFKEVNFLQAKYDNMNEGFFSLKGLVEDIDNYRGKNSNQKNKRKNNRNNNEKNNRDNNNRKNDDENDNFEIEDNIEENGDERVNETNFGKVVKKLKRMNPDLIKDFLIYSKEQNHKLGKVYDKRDLEKMLKKLFDNKLKNSEISLMINFIDINKNDSIEIFELIDFLVTYFGKTQDVIKIYLTLIGYYLDQKNIYTRNFLKDFNIYDDSVFNKNRFIKKLQVVLGVMENHGEIFWDFYKEDHEVRFKNIIKDIELNRKFKNDKIPKKNKIDNFISDEENLNVENDENDENYGKKKNNEKSISKKNILNKKEIKDVFNNIRLNLKDLLNKYQLEMDNINRFVLEQKDELNIIQLKKHLLEIFEKNETKLFLNYFKKADLNKNGWIDKKEWKKLTVNLGITQAKKKKKNLDMKLKNDHEFYTYIIKEFSNDERKIEKNIVYELSDFEEKSISMIILKRFLKSKFENKDITDILQLLKYLDNCKNGFVKFEDFSFLMVLGSNVTLEKDFEIDMFRKNFICFDKLMKYSEDEDFNVFKILRRVIKYFNDEDEKNFVGFLNKNYNVKGSFNLTYDEFLEYGNVKNDIEKFVWILEKNKNTVEILQNLRKNIHKKRDNEKPLLVLFNELSNSEKKVLKNVYELDFNDSEKTREFLDFILFYDWRDIIAMKDRLDNMGIMKNTIKNKLLKQTSSLKEDNFDLIDLVTNKLISSISHKDEDFVKNKVKLVFNGENDNQMNFEKFDTLLKKLSNKISGDESLQLFKNLDTDGNHRVSKEEFLLYLQSNLKIYLKSDLRRGSSFGKIDIMNKLSKKVTTKLSKTQKKLSQNLKSFKLTKKHYFRGHPTILTCPIAALKKTLEITQNLSKTKKKYEDLDFGPNEEDNYGSRAIYPEAPISGYPDPETLAWLRPEEISKEQNPVFMDNGAESNDVIQGYLGDCWFIGALSIIATNDELLFHDLKIEELKNGVICDELAGKLVKGVYPKIFHHLSQFGIYVFRFFKNYQWVYVLIDDRIPCYSGNEASPDIVFAKCHNRCEFWVPLIEKAYAKLHGNYWALVGGQLDDALVDMTGRVSEKIKVLTNKNKFNLKELKSKEELWKRLNDDLDNKSMLGCSIKKGKNVRGEGKVFSKKGDFLGLYSGHAYGILDLIDIGSEKLLRIRNPWGSENPVEWNGAYSDNSVELIQHLDILNKKIKEKWGKEAELIEKEQKDGGFLMQYSEFVSIWHNISICKKFNTHYDGIRFIGEWNEETSGGTPYSNDQTQFDAYLKNPQFIVSIKKQTHLFVSLGQEDGRIKSKGVENFPYQNFNSPLSICIFKIQKNQNKLEFFDGNNLLNPPFIKLNRDVQVEVILEKGKYAVVPATKDIGEYCKFFLSLYYDCGNENIEVEGDGEKGKGFKIEEESEEHVVFDEDIKSLLKEVILNNH